jgi:hypothetical protein
MVGSMHPTAYLASHPRLRAFYTPPHASWLNQAALLRRAFADKYLQRVDAPSRQHLIDHLEASWPEYNRRFATPSPGHGVAARCIPGPERRAR